MSIPSTFAPIKNQDFTLVRIPVKKSFSITSANLTNTSSGYNLIDGYYTSTRTPVGAPQANNDPRNTFDQSYKHIIWQSINHLYYRNPYDSYAAFEHTNRRYTWKFLNRTASILSVPYMDYGEQIVPGSVQFTSSFGYYIKDDKNGNLYDSTITTSSFATRQNVVAYWGFNDIFKKFKWNFGTITKGTLKYISHTFEPENLSGVKNVYFNQGVKINNTSSGMAAVFNNTSYIMTYNRPEFNFNSNQDFTIACWIKAPLSQSVLTSTSNALLTKNGAIYKEIYGNVNAYTQDGQIIAGRGLSSSLQSEKTDVFPYGLEIYNQTTANSGKIVFKRSDGIRTVTLTSTSSIANSQFRHVTVTRAGTLIKLYVDGTLHSSASDSTLHPINDHVIMFGSRNFEFKDAFSGSMDEIRIYDKALTQANISTLANKTNMSLYQTAVIGNVFYRKGNVVISSLDPKYTRLFNNTWTFNYEGKHTIFQYEILCRVKKGSFNLTMNPTARQHPQSDMYRDSITGSLLMPYMSSIGLYNDRGELMAVAKPSQPVQVRSDVDINFMVRFDV